MLPYSPRSQQNQEMITAIVVGDVRVGKTTLVRRACRVNSEDKIIPTIGIQFAATSLIHKQSEFRIKFWDLCTGCLTLAGQKKYQNLFDSYIERCNLAIIVFDLTNFESFHNAREWVSQIHTKHEDIHVILFGNKKDLYDEKVKIKAKDRVVQVDKEVIKKFVEDTGVVYQEGCALSDDKLRDSLKKVIQRDFLPNQVILQGANQAKTCGCFC